MPTIIQCTNDPIEETLFNELQDVEDMRQQINDMLDASRKNGVRIVSMPAVRNTEFNGVVLSPQSIQKRIIEEYVDKYPNAFDTIQLAPPDNGFKNIVIYIGQRNPGIPRDNNAWSVEYFIQMDSERIEAEIIRNKLIEWGFNNSVKIGKKNCYQKFQIVIEDDITEIESKAFAETETFKACKGLTSVTIPDSVTTIGSGVFCGCNELVRLGLNPDTDPPRIVIPTHVQRINSNLFKDCTKLTSVEIPEGVNEIGSKAFSGCTSLTRVAMPRSIRAIWNEAFDNCKNLPRVIISKKVDEIAYNAFEIWDGSHKTKHAYSIPYRQFDLVNQLENNNIADIIQTNATPDIIIDTFYQWMRSFYYWKGKNETDTTLAFNEYSIWLNRALDNNDGSSCKDCIGAILDWGGVGQNKDTHIPQFYSALLRISDDINNGHINLDDFLNYGHNPIDNRDRISSWSKILAAYMPGTCFIYDSRVALSLSYISLKLDHSSNDVSAICFWRIPQERNDDPNNRLRNRSFIHFLPGNNVRGATEANRGRINDQDKPEDWISEGDCISTCYRRYLLMLNKLADNELIKRAYSLLPTDIKKAYEKVYAFDPNQERRSHKAIMSHLEKMLFMQKDFITQ